MSIFVFGANGSIAVSNGVAYGLVAGGATTFIDPLYRWYTGNNYDHYLAMLASRGVDVWRIAAILAVRGAITEAAAQHAAELGELVNAGALRLNAAELLDDAAVDALVVRGRLVTGQWRRDGQNIADAAVFTANRVSDTLRTQLTTPELDKWAKACAQMSYSVIADNGYGLITAGHHYRGQAANAAINTMKMYGLVELMGVLGVVLKEAAGFLFHDVLHPLSYEHVARVANSPPASFSAKVAATILKRLPAFPGGVTHIQRGVTVRRLLKGYAPLSTVLAQMWGSDADQELMALEAMIVANPLDFNPQFRPQAAPANVQRAGGVVMYVITLFAIYDAVFPPRRGEENQGPTRGPGMKKLIDENLSTYQSVFDAIGEVISNAVPVAFTDIVGGLCAMGNQPAQPIAVVPVPVPAGAPAAPMANVNAPPPPGAGGGGRKGRH